MPGLPTPLTALHIPVPAALESALGYHGPARWLGVAWEPAGDELLLSDGATTTVGVGNWHAFLQYTSHPAVARALDCFNLGDSMTPADHWLLLDRQERRIYAAEAEAARAFLRAAIAPADQPAVEISLPEKPVTTDDLIAFARGMHERNRAEWARFGATTSTEYMLAVMHARRAAETDLARELAEAQ